MEKHVTLVGVLHIVYHALGVVWAFVIFGLLGVVGRVSGDPDAAVILGVVGAVVATMLIVLSVPGIIGGIGLLRNRGWGRIVAMVVGILGLIDVPFGTALGVYTLWVLMHDDAIPLFRDGAKVVVRPLPPSAPASTEA